MNRIFIVGIIGISLIAGAAGGGIYMFARAKLRARRRRLHKEEMERMVGYSEYAFLFPAGDDVANFDKKINKVSV